VLIGFWAWVSPFPTDDIRATLLNGLSRVLFLAVTGGLLLVLTRKFEPGFRRLAPLVLIVIAWLDVFTHEPAQNPTVPPGVYEQNLARADLKMKPQPAPGKSRAMVRPGRRGIHQLCRARSEGQFPGQAAGLLCQLQSAGRRAEG